MNESSKAIQKIPRCRRAKTRENLAVNRVITLVHTKRNTFKGVRKCSLHVSQSMGDAPSYVCNVVGGKTGSVKDVQGQE